MAMHRFDWNDLRYFLTVARTGKLTSAARLLETDHATVSRRIAAVEGALNAKLFERSPRGYSLTEHGEKLLSFAETIETQAIAAENQIADANYSLSGIVRVGTPDGFGSYFLGPRIGGLLQVHADLEIQLVAVPRIFNLSKREADLAIGLTPPPAGRLYARKLTDYQLGLFAAPAYLARHRPIREVEDLRRHTLIGYIDDLIYTPELDYLPEILADLHPQLKSSNLIAQLRATVAGSGICILPHFMAGEHPDLVPVLEDTVMITRAFWLIVHSDMRDLARVRTVIEFIAGQVQAARPLFAPHPA
jgi:DNA-binding transcriptional LysR family regulator